MKTVETRVKNPDVDLVRRAFRFANRAHRHQKRLSGEPYIIHPLAVGQELAELGLDTTTIAAGLLHDVVEDTRFGEETIQSEFGEEIQSLVRAVTKISAVKNKGAKPSGEAKEREAAENIRLMLLATARDVRVILIKLADKLHNMRTLSFQKPEKVSRIAGEVMNIYAPIAGRLGMFEIKSELEDLAFERLSPADYKSISESLDQTRDELAQFIAKVRDQLKAKLTEADIAARVEGRAKHVHSIFNKMVKYEKRLEHIYDLRGIRVIVNKVGDCYEALGIVHTLWPPIAGRFKDYIATPKENGYQSLHTTVVGPEGRPLEVQIRTREMDERAMYGVAAHWVYKGDGSARKNDPIQWLSRLSKIDEEEPGTKQFLEGLQNELAHEEVYVFTPVGDIIHLPLGSSVIDFAFRVHTQIGLRCRGARVNDRIVPLRTVLKSGDRVEVLTDKNPNPSPNWLRYIQSPHARQKLRQYFRKKELEELRDQGILPAPTPVEKKHQIRPEKLTDIPALRIRRSQTGDPTRVPIEVAGSKDIPVRYAGCCSPVPGDRIVGFVTRGRGVTVHRADCKHLPNHEQDRILAVKWEGLTEKYPVLIEIRARDRQGLYLDLVGGISRTYTNILKAEADIPRHESDLMRARFLIEVEHVDHLNEILESIGAIPGVVSVDRIPEKKA